MKDITCGQRNSLLAREEALDLEAAYQRWLGEQRDARLAAIETRLGSAS